MKTLVLKIVLAGATIGFGNINYTQASAPRECGGCTAFKKLTHEFEKNVIEAATNGDPNTIPGLLEQYSADVRALDFTH